MGVGASGLDLVQAEVDAAVGVVRPRHRQPGHAVVAVAQQLDAKAVALLNLKIQLKMCQELFSGVIWAK